MLGKVEVDSFVIYWLLFSLIPGAATSDFGTLCCSFCYFFIFTLSDTFWIVQGKKRRAIYLFQVLVILTSCNLMQAEWYVLICASSTTNPHKNMCIYIVLRLIAEIFFMDSGWWLGRRVWNTCRLLCHTNAYSTFTFTNNKLCSGLLIMQVWLSMAWSVWVCLPSCLFIIFSSNTGN